MQHQASDSITRVIVLSLFSVAIFVGLALPPKSTARLEPPQTAATKGKRSRPAFVPGQVLVRYSSESVAKRQARTQSLRVSSGSIVFQIERLTEKDIVEGLRLARVPEQNTWEAIEALRKQPDVLYAEPNYVLHADLTPNDPNFSSLYGLTKIGAPTAWNTTTGSPNIVIGVVDQGIDFSHQDLNANRWINPLPGSIVPSVQGDVNGYNFLNNTGTIFSGHPDEDHASHVAGIAGAVGNNGIGVVGVNWNVRLMSLKFLDTTGGGSDADAIRAFTYAKEARDLWVSSNHSLGANVRVLNNSYGGGGFSSAFRDAIQALNSSGILFVAAAGNLSDGPELDNDVNPHYPSSYEVPNIIAVANTDSSDFLNSSSHFGANSVHLGAPGTSILSTTPGNGYQFFSGTSMATPHVSGAAALLLAQSPDIPVQQLKNLLILNGDVVPSLQNKTITGRRLNVGNSMQTLINPDSTPPGAVTGLQINSQNGRNLNVGWIASGDDGAGGGSAALYEVTFTDARTGGASHLKYVVPAAPGAPQSVDVKIPYRHTRGNINVRVFDNAGNEGTPASREVTVNFAQGDPYASTLSIPVVLSTGGTRHFGTAADDDRLETFALPFPFPFFGTNQTSLTISTNGNLFFSPPPHREDPTEADDVPSSTFELSKFKMISGLWDDIDLRSSSRADAGVYVVQPDANRVIFRWQGVPCNYNGTICTGGAPINFEIELRSDGTIKSRYGSGNTSIFPVVGISGGEPDAYVIPSHTSEDSPTSLTNAVEVTYIPRAVFQPLENNYFFVSQNYRDFLGREPDLDGLSYWANEQLNACDTAPDPPACKNQRRVGVSAAFFTELEFQRTGSFVYRLSKGGLGRRPTFTEFNNDRAQVVEGPNLEATKRALALAFVQRPEFVAKFAGQDTASAFVDRLIASIQTNSQINLTSISGDLINAYNTGSNQNESRAFAVRAAIDAPAFTNGEFNRAFVLMQYFGYLHRDPDQGGYDFWLDVVDNRATNNYRAMVCAFITSDEYQLLFSTIIPRHNPDCANIN